MYKRYKRDIKKLKIYLLYNSYKIQNTSVNHAYGSSDAWVLRFVLKRIKVVNLDC